MPQKPTIVDLFSGCGGFGLGAELAGFSCIAAIDIDPTLQSAYQTNFPRTKAFQADVGTLGKSFWQHTLGKHRPNGVIGGPPCQGFSRIGKRDKKDPRNNLVQSFFDHIAMLDPDFFIMENVEGILDTNTIDVLTSAMEPVSTRFRILDPMIITASDYGAPTKRQRVIIVGYNPSRMNALSISDFTPLKKMKTVTVQDAIFDLPSPIMKSGQRNEHVFSSYRHPYNASSNYAQLARSLPRVGLGAETAVKNLRNGLVSGLEVTQHTQAVVDRFADVKQGTTEAISRYPRLSWQGLCPTLRAGTGRDKGSYQAMRPIHPSENRVITVREAARLQGFPDWFQFHPTKWHSFRMIGNSVSPIVSKHLLGKIKNKLDN
ncbi:DNA cytosine methyltransferase [Thalassospira lucentensis]|uniref:DNA (cytosine-5-)-methyltransferase n=1 Tax=Thalassospira lucentensis TaxID=168935 RepID=A0A358HPG6_9PROT|nr:DNA cytosine methyltransferase [Thalassospira lucentensis]HBU97066.1 DNA (cytosine-5-)-methyltransferase [Thalassospira lucentensis]HCW67785.1 DNA (cytosine-5-)-methyltransferase [Thalassospira lucentensis]|tara:strand:- start:2827 stop:3948 length:1122 start_codon:yes stop_codon:yes gene_type:complete